jgi:glycosyltransferase involved in cell wall biosynthesis
MRIAIVHHQYAKKGGMETYLFDLIAGFTAAGDAVDVIVYRVDEKLFTPPSTISPLCSVIKHNVYLPGILRKLFFAYYINKFFRKGDYDLSLSLTRTAGQDISVCGGTHLAFLHYMRKPRMTLKDRLEIYCERKSYMSSSLVMAHSGMLKDEIVQFYGIDPRKVCLLYPPLNTKVFVHRTSEQRAQCRKKFGFAAAASTAASGKTILLFPSTGHKRKGWYELAAAMHLLPPERFELVVAGSGVDAAMIAALPQKVHVLGYVNNMAELYAAVDFTILPSHYEPYGLVVAESLQCGTPVIISDRVGAKDFVTPETGVVLNEITPAAIAQAILDAEAKLGACGGDRDRASSSCFHIPPNFAEQHGLTLEAHIAQIKAIARSLR